MESQQKRQVKLAAGKYVQVGAKIRIVESDYRHVVEAAQQADKQTSQKQQRDDRQRRCQQQGYLQPVRH